MLFNPFCFLQMIRLLHMKKKKQQMDMPPPNRPVEVPPFPNSLIKRRPLREVE